MEKVYGGMIEGAGLNFGGSTMTRRFPLLMLGYLLLAAPLHAQDDMQEKIRRLEQQVQELKTLQAQQAVGKQKAE